MSSRDAASYISTRAHRIAVAGLVAVALLLSGALLVSELYGLYDARDTAAEMEARLNALRARQIDLAGLEGQLVTLSEASPESLGFLKTKTADEAMARFEQRVAAVLVESQAQITKLERNIEANGPDPAPLRLIVEGLIPTQAVLSTLRKLESQDLIVAFEKATVERAAPGTAQFSFSLIGYRVSEP